MATWCLVPEKVQQFKKALKDKEIDPAKLALMASKERNAFLSKFVGAENATQVNSLFESKLLLKNQQAGMISWAKKVAGLTPEVRRDLLSKIEKMDRVLNPQEGEQFLQDLAQTRLGVGVSEQEAKTISELSNKVRETKQAIPETAKPRSQERLNYGYSLVNFEKYVNDLKLKANQPRLREYLNPLKITSSISGTLKSLVASFDNSLWGRQGIKTLLNPRTSHIWAKNFLKSWGDIGKELLGKDAIDSVKADIYSRPNALNGKYKAGGYGLDVLSEEAYPSHILAKIPLLSRLYKASESAYNGGALRLRADLADKWINIAEKQGINTLDPKQAKGIGTLVSAITGRGSLGKAEVLAKEANMLLFSVKFLKSNFDTLTLHGLDSKATKFTRIEAGKNLLGMVGSLATIFSVAKALDPNSVDLDPQGSNFGKVKIFGEWTDITGGLAGMTTLASRIIPTYHDGRWSFWSKSKSGQWTDLQSGKFGSQTALDVFEGYWEGKLSPAAGIVRDLWSGKTFSGEDVNLWTELKNQLPLTKQTYDSLLKDPNASNVMGSIILDSLGLAVNPILPKPPKENTWLDNPTKSQSAFLNKVGKDKFQEANKVFNSSYQNWLNGVKDTPTYKNLTPDQKNGVNQKAKNRIEDAVFKQYGFKYVVPPKTRQDLQKEQQMEQSLPKKVSQAILDKLIPTAYASDIGGSTNIKMDFRSGKTTTTTQPGIIENIVNAISSLFKSNSQSVQAQTSKDYNQMKLTVNVSPNLAKDEQVSTPAELPRTPISKDGQIDFKAFPNDQKSATRPNFHPPQPPQEIADLVKKYFGNDYATAILVAASEDAHYNPRAQNTWNDDGSIDRGIFAINSNSFNGLMKRQGNKLKEHGINSFEDMFDPDKNIYVAKLIKDESQQANPKTNGWGRWFGWQDTGYNINNGWYSAPKRIEYELAKKK